VHIEPVLNLSLNTQAKGVDVVLSVTGPIDNTKLKLHVRPAAAVRGDSGTAGYRQNANLGPDDSREPAAGPAQTFAQMGESGVVSKTVADSVASRLQGRLFGVSQ